LLSKWNNDYRAGSGRIWWSDGCFPPPAPAQTTLPPEYVQQLNQVIAVNRQ
jgi:hypothetical protein